MLRKAAFASSVLASIPIVLPFTKLETHRAVFTWILRCLSTADLRSGAASAKSSSGRGKGRADPASRRKRRCTALQRNRRSRVAQQLIQPPIKRMAGGRRQVRRRKPHRRLSIACARAHRHGRSVVRDVERVDHSARAASGPYHRGCSAMFQSVATARRPLPTHLMPMSAAERRRSASCAP